MFETMPLDPGDPVLGLSKIFKQDKRINKINLGIGVYTDHVNDAPIFNSVKIAAQSYLAQETNKNYLNIEGSESFNISTQSLLFGDTNQVIHKDRMRTIQSIGGTGALRIAAECIAKTATHRRKIWISNPSWINHKNIFLASGLEVHTYPYFDFKTHKIDFDKLYLTLNQIKSKDLVLFHGCCHNPTGVDPNLDQWQILSECAKKNQWIPVFDLAYQGFGCDLQSDLKGLHIFCQNNAELIICNSYSKNFGLYNERIGACTIVAEDSHNANKALSQLRSVIRANYSSPPCHGAAIVSTILSNKKLRSKWETELTNIRERIKKMRALFSYKLNKFNQPVSNNFNFIKNQKGMFAFLGLNFNQVNKLKEQFGIYLVGSGRVNLAGLTEHNVEYVCSSIKKIFNE